MQFHFYMKVTGSSQGGFASESPRAGEGRTVCYRFHFKGTANNDPTQGPKLAARSHDPLYIVKAWGSSSPQFMQAFWHNEILKEVVLDFIRPADGDDEAPFEQIVLKNATVVSIERKAADRAEGMPEGPPFEMEEIGFRFEEMTHKSVPGKTVAKYDWKNR